jgi:renierapurpurin 18,18'-hydroxylase
MSETLSADDETMTAEPETGLGRSCDHRSGAAIDLRRVGINPNFWYPVALSGDVRKKKTFAATFAGERIALYRGDSGTVYALEDRCAHRQVPLSMGVVEGDVLRCCYHAWAYCGNGRISQIPYLPRGAARPPRGVRSYPIQEAYGLVFVFPGDPHDAAETALPELPEFNSARHKTMTFSRIVGCHYSIHAREPAGHEPPVPAPRRRRQDPAHAPRLRHQPAFCRGPVPVTHAGGKKNRGAGLLSARGAGGTASPDVITIRTACPYQTLQLVPENAELPAFSLWVAYVPEDAEQRTNHVYGLLMIEKPPIPGAIHLAWPLIRRFTERVFAEDRTAVEAEQRAWDEQGEDRNREVFPLIMDVRHVLRTNGVPLRPESALCGAAAFCSNPPLASTTPHAEPDAGH